MERGGDSETVISFGPPKGVFTTRVWVCVWILEQCECEEGMSVSVPMRKKREVAGSR